MKAGRFHPAQVLAGMLSLCTAALAQAQMDPAPATDGIPFGAWRNLQTEAGYEPAQRNLAFAMLPQAATRGDRFAILDREGRRTVCCLQVASPSLGVNALREQYHLPAVWVADLSNLHSAARPYVPHVYAMQRVDELIDYRFADVPGAYSDLGGLLLPEGAAVDAAGTNVRWGQAQYQLKFQRLPQADEEGALDRYTLQLLPAGTPLQVEVPFGTY